MSVKNQRLAMLALGVLPLILALGCFGFGKKSKEDEIADMKAKLAELEKDYTADAQGAMPVEVPQGTKFKVSLSGGITTTSHHAGNSWNGQLVQDVVVDGKTVWGTGTAVSGVVSQSEPTGRLSNGNGILAIRLTNVGSTAINGSTFSVKGEDKTARNAKVIGTSTGLGAVAGLLSSKNHKGDHALGGALIGAGVGTAVAAGTANTVITMPGRITFSLQAPVSVMVD